MYNNTIVDNEINKNTISCLTDIVKIIKAFYGDIYGGFIYNRNIFNKIQNKTECINFRIDSQLLGIFLKIISINFYINEIETSLDETVINNIYKLEHKTQKTHPITINTLILSKKIFRCLSPDFDIDLMTEDSNSMYIRCITPLMRFNIDLLSHIRNRINERRFCTLHRIYPVKTSRDVAETVSNAILLVKNGWIMDDNLLGDNAWIIVIWGDYIKDPQKFRTKQNIVNHIHDDFCSLCHEKFKLSDIILSTSCCHNFHWQCTNDNNMNGLKKWVIGQNKLCCPYCRSIMF